MPAIAIHCPVCDLAQPVVNDPKREGPWDSGPSAKVLFCGAVALVSFSQTVWLNFDQHKKEQPS